MQDLIEKFNIFYEHAIEKINKKEKKLGSEPIDKYKIIKGYAKTEAFVFIKKVIIILFSNVIGR